jgi:hypothetical protein
MIHQECELIPVGQPFADALCGLLPLFDILFDISLPLNNRLD